MASVDFSVCVIVDLVGSRQHRDRAWVHASFVAAMAGVNDVVPALQPLEPTVGDEAQARYATLGAALDASLRIRLLLPDGLDARSGIGMGHVQVLGVGAAGLLQDGPGWWAARDAIDEAKVRQSARDRSLRTWCAVATDVDAVHDVDAVNAVLLLRDEVVTGMNERSRRLLRGVLDDLTQAELAEAEGISASAVSQNLRRSGAYAVLHAHERLVGSSPERGDQEERHADGGQSHGTPDPEVLAGDDA